jgi:F-type H+-transporting ATPase subunit b
VKRASVVLLGMGFLALVSLSGVSPAVAEEHAAPAGHEAVPGAHEAGHAEGGGETHEGAEHEGPAIDGKKLALQLVNFGVLLFILIKFGGSAVNKALLARHQQLKADLAAAAEARTAAEARLKKQEQRLANLEKEIASMRIGIQQEADAEKERLIAAAEERAKRIREETAFIIDQQVKEGEAALRREASNGAMKIAEELLRRSMTGGDQQRLVDTFVDDVAGNGQSGKVA